MIYWRRFFTALTLGVLAALGIFFVAAPAHAGIFDSAKESVVETARKVQTDVLDEAEGIICRGRYSHAEWRRRYQPVEKEWQAFCEAVAGRYGGNLPAFPAPATIDLDPVE